MKNKLTLLVAVAVAATALTLFRAAGTQAQTSSPRDNFTLEGLARRAKANGSYRVDMETTLNEIQVPSLDDAISKYSVFVIQANYVQSFRAGDFDLETWSKAKLLETVSQRTYVGPCATCAQPPSAKPSVFPAPQPDEILIPEAGGTFVVDGVTFYQYAGTSGFIPGKTYVVFVNLNTSNQIGTVVGGGFEVGADGDTLIPLDKGDSPSPIVTGVASRYGNSLNQMRAAL